ncbi:MAG TPA: DUF6785 family protein, partial [Chthonomonadales bacterium]|nr:DUF6785 family protein [Chthonomonadales bacterium]
HFGFFLPFLVNPFYYGASSRPEWKSFWSALPSWIGPRDPAVLKGFYLGHSTLFTPQVLRAWAPPLALWSLFFLALLWTTLCLSEILRRRWADEEHLAFPVIALPLEMTRDSAPIYRSRLLWLGFALPCALHSLNSLQYLYPTLPSIHMNSVHDLVGDLSLQPPWSGSGSLLYQLHPAGVGFGFLVDTDISFSLWIFYVIRKAVLIWAASLALRDSATGWGADANDQFPFLKGQACGAWLMLGLTTLWTGRRYFQAYVHRAIRGTAEDNPAAMSARTAVLGFAGGFLALCGLTWTWGGSWWMPAAFLTIYLLLAVSIARVRAEMAVVCSELAWVNPQTILPAITGTNTVSTVDLSHMASLSWFNLDYRTPPMAHQMEALVGMQKTRGRLKPLVPALMLAALTAIGAAAMWDLHLYYSYGAASAFVNSWRIDKGSESWTNLQNWLQNPKPPDAHLLGSMAVGAGITVALSLLRARFVGFPFHPAGYAINMSFANDFFWCDMLVAWMVKTTILRYGGMKGYRRALPFFLGLILGDFVTGSAWSIFGALKGLDMFRTFAT